MEVKPNFYFGPDINHLRSETILQSDALFDLFRRKG